jgi:hypothetical protein
MGWLLIAIPHREPLMSNFWKSLLQVELIDRDQRRQLAQMARERRWGIALAAIGWLHLLAFSVCYYLTIVQDYHGSAGYLAIWIAELLGIGLIFRLCGGPTKSDPVPLELFIRRVWIGYFLLAFNLGSLNTLRGHQMFEFFPAMASLASFAFLVMSIVIHWRFILAVLVLFVSGLFMAAFLLHAYLIFALAWWLVLNVIGAGLWLRRRTGVERS